jgi:2-oxoglutarate ferredoxin oxidoreductase subunit delta
MPKKTEKKTTQQNKKTTAFRITIDREICKGCQLCISVCPKHLISVSDKLNQKGYYPAEVSKTDDHGEPHCTGCVSCATICPDVAIEVYRE